MKKIKVKNRAPFFCTESKYWVPLSHQLRICKIKINLIHCITQIPDQIKGTAAAVLFYAKFIFLCQNSGNLIFIY